jgi:hypothetical protein
MRLCSTALTLLALVAATVAARAQDAKTPAGTTAGDEAEKEREQNNSANNPVEPRLTAQYWNYFAPSLNNVDGTAENALGRILIPFKIAGIQQVMHVVSPIVTNSTAKSGPRTGLGDIQLYNFALTKQDVGLFEPVTFGIGPLLAVPSSTSTNFGPHTLQAGGGAVIIAPQKWGLLGVLATYQHTVSGASSSYTTVQPNVFYNLVHGYYLRSSAIMEFNTGTNTSVVPLGIGLGKVIQLPGGYTLNIYAEAQPSIYRAGDGAPNFQFFTAIKIQFPPSATDRWNVF